MNQFFYEQSAKEKLNDLRNEGQRSQAYYRSGAPKVGLIPNLPKLLLGVLGALGILGLLVR